MRGGLERWKRGVESHGVRQALAYAFRGTCDSHLRSVAGADALAAYGTGDGGSVTRFAVEAGQVAIDCLGTDQLRMWVDGRDPFEGAYRGRELTSPQADLILDGTINAPKTYSIASLINAELAREYEELQDRLRDRILTTWQSQLNARRGAGGRIRESLSRIEVVELRHRRSRALDPHIHRHLWLNVKVRGEDGKWSNVDSRVAMKLHTLINAEGELAARTDPIWIAALARHGYTLDEDGEISQLAGAVRPLSRRSNQIEANRARLLLGWRSEHPGLEPSHDVLATIDRMAWAGNRPNKPREVDETEWERLVRAELGSIDVGLLQKRRPVQTRSVAIGALDRDLLAARAVVDADRRATATGGRFSSIDLIAGATRAIAASEVVATRPILQELIDDVARRSRELVVDLLPHTSSRPKHIKCLMAVSTAGLKVELAAQLDRIGERGHPLGDVAIEAIGSRILRSGSVLDERQKHAAAAIAGSDRLVSITGPAGSGKTTMLRIVRVALLAQKRRLIVVAPTKKAASVAGREIGAAAASLHALLADHGWRWGRDAAGAAVWTRLLPGEADPRTGVVHHGPRRFALEPGDRVVVDEAGMVDLECATALAAVLEETGAGVAMVGDHLQARPVGHSGAMACLTRRATAVVELSAVHRFRDPEYAELTLRMREPSSPEEALKVATELGECGEIVRVSNEDEARRAMVDAYFAAAGARQRVAIVTSTNAEADAINEAIQERRLAAGQLRQDRIALGQGEQRLLEGDVVQTRLNDKAAGVENRALWVIRRILPGLVELTAAHDEADIRRVSRDYAAEFVHLAYASTVHGIQGETTERSIVGPGVDASGFYVGMTRGRLHNAAVAIARTDELARTQIAENLMRGALEVTVDDSIAAAQRELGRAALPPDSDAASAPPSSSPRSRADALVSLAHKLRGWLTQSSGAILAAESHARSFEAGAHARRVDGESAAVRVPGVDRLRALVVEREQLLERYELELAQIQIASDTSILAVQSGRPVRRSEPPAAPPPIQRDQSAGVGI